MTDNTELKVPKYITIKEQLRANEVASKWGKKIPYPDAEKYRQYQDAYKEKS